LLHNQERKSWKITPSMTLDKYGNGLMIFKESITAITKKNAVVRKVTEEIKVYTEKHHLKSVYDNIKEMYSELKTAILNLGKDIEVRPTKSYIAFRRKHNVVSFHFLRSMQTIPYTMWNTNMFF
jgi:Domain of unknown function (DUF5655)